MNIEIETKNINNDKMVREFIYLKVHFALDRIESRVGKVTVRLEDEKIKHSNAFEGVCEINANLKAQGHVCVTAAGESPFDSVLQAIQRMEQVIEDDADRHRTTPLMRFQKPEQLNSKSAAESGAMETRSPFERGLE